MSTEGSPKDPSSILADGIEGIMARLGFPGGPRYGTPEWDASVAEGNRRSDERRAAYLKTHPDAVRFPDEEGYVEEGCTLLEKTK
jgi:hypothetical protein